VQCTKPRLAWHRDVDAIAKDARTDGLFPLVDHTDLDAPDVLLTYKMQPYLEKRFATKKSVLGVAPVFLKKPQRIEARWLVDFFFRVRRIGDDGQFNY